MSLMEQAEALIKEAHYNRVGTTTTVICSLELQSGFVVVGTASCCLNKAEFNEDYGRRLSYQDAFEKLIENVVFLNSFNP